MNTSAYNQRRSEVATYFDKTAVDAWRKLTSDAPVSKFERPCVPVVSACEILC